MPEYLAPGVYVEEVQSGNKPIEGVSTSTAGLVGITERGPVNVPQLVTSYGEYQRLFGGRLPRAEFLDGAGHAHCYLPHAVEGFFLNGGKRAYVTRVLRDEADRASRNLFFADPAVVSPGESVLLRAAQQGTGTPVNRPLLYSLDINDFMAGDWIRIGDGSRAEYRNVISTGADARHVALDFPLRNAHAAAGALQAVAVAADGGFADAVFALVDDAAAGAIQILVDNGDDASLLAALPAGTPAAGWRVLEVGTAPASEYLYAREATAGAVAGQVLLTLAQPLRVARIAGIDITVLDTAGATADTLDVAANSGDALAYVTTVPLPADYTTVGNLILFEPGNAAQEAHRIGALMTLPLVAPAYADYPAGSTGRQVTTVDDDRLIVGVLGAGPVLQLNDVTGIVPGMTLVFDIGAGENGVVTLVDAITRNITLQAALSAVPASATVRVPPKGLTADATAGTLTLSLDNRLGMSVGDVIRIDADEIAVISEIVGQRGPAPDAGAVRLHQALRATHLMLTPTEIRRQIVAVAAGRQPITLVLGATNGATDLLVSDGTGYALGDVLQVTLPDGTNIYHRLAANAAPTAPREIELDSSLTYGHDAGQGVFERERLLELRALDAGDWGNRLMASCRDEVQGLVSNALVQGANPPPGPGMFSSLQLSSLTGVEPGSVLELLDPAGAALGLPYLKAHSVDRNTRLVLLDAPGLQAAHMTAHNNAMMAGQNLRVRSREFSLSIQLRQRPDPAVPTRDEGLLDQELFRQLSLDPRHSRYVMRVVGATWTPGNSADDLGITLRRWDLRSEGSSAYVRVNDLAAPVDRERIRLGPEALIDITPSGLRRPARHRFGERPFVAGDDAVALISDALYIGTDSNEPTLRTGLYTLKNLLNVSLVSTPGQTGAALQQAVIDHCEDMRYRFAVLDGPPPDNDTLTDVQVHRQQYDSKYAALYHPWLMIPDPFPATLSTIAAYPVPPSGHMLGIYARVDNERGVHKAPANEVVRGITGLRRYFTKGEQDILNPYPQNINVIRDFRTTNRGMRVWGARCITSDNDYKYVNVRRLLIFLEDSIDRGLQWVVFEPNAEELWARVRRAVTNFLTTVWRNGALEGTTPAQGFFVRCDRSTMTRDDLDNGRLICLIGVAPVKPAEFVIIRIGLWTADAQN